LPLVISVRAEVEDPVIPGPLQYVLHDPVDRCVPGAAPLVGVAGGISQKTEYQAVTYSTEALPVATQPGDRSDRTRPKNEAICVLALREAGQPTPDGGQDGNTCEVVVTERRMTRMGIKQDLDRLRTGKDGLA